MVPNNSCPYNRPVKLDWWKEDHFLNYHRSKGHNTDNCFKLKDAIQDLTDGGIILMDDLIKNFDHKSFKHPYLSMKKGNLLKKIRKITMLRSTTPMLTMRM